MADNIRTYSNTLAAPQPDDRGAQALAKAGSAAAVSGMAWDDALSGIGRDIGGKISQIGQEYVRQITAEETAKGSAKLAEAHAALTTEWNDIVSTADPNNIEKLATDFREKRIQPTLSAIGDGMSTDDGQNFFTRAEAEVTSHFFEKTAADVASLKGVAAVQNAITVRNQLSHSAFKDPSSFSASVQLSHMATEAMVKEAGLPREKAIELNAAADHEFAVSAAMGMIQANPTAAKKDIADGRFDKYLDGSDIGTLVNRADQAEKAQTEQEKAARVEKVRVEKEAFTKKVNEVISQTVRPDGSLTVPPDYYKTAMALSLLPQADDATIRAVIGFGRSVADDIEKGTPVVTDPNTYEDFRNRAFLPASDPRALSSAEVIQARADRKLSDADFRFWGGAVNEMRKDENQSNTQKDFGKFLSGYKSYITKSNFLAVDAYGDQKYYDWSSWAQKTHDAMVAQKVPEEKIRERLVAEIPRYQPPRETNVDGTIKQATGNLVPLPMGPLDMKRQPGESAAQFLKRQAGQ